MEKKKDLPYYIIPGHIPSHPEKEKSDGPAFPETVIDCVDEYEFTRHRILLTEKQIQIPGLRTFGFQTNIHAFPDIPKHFHREAAEFVFILEGSFHFETEKGSYSLRPGEILITSPGEIHSTNKLPFSIGKIYWLQLETCCKNPLYLTSESAKILFSMLTENGTRIVSFDSEKSFLFLNRAFQAILQDTPSGRCMAASLLSALLYQIADSDEKRTAPITADMEAALSYIHFHIREELELEKIASFSGLSLSQFKQKFKKQLGISPRLYINHQKIEEAKRLLLSGSSITDTAMELSFNTSSYFTSVFRQFTACTPSEFLHREAEIHD